MIKYDAEYIINHMNEFYVTKDNKAYPYKKDDIIATIDPYNHCTVRPWCKEFDIPFLVEDWEQLVHQTENITSRMFQHTDVLFGKYLAKMKLCGYKNFKYSDSDKMNECARIRQMNEATRLKYE